MLNILTEQIIRMKTASGSAIPASLPDVYAALMSDQVDAFSALRPHQRHAWHAFLVQLGAMAMHCDGITEPPKDAAEWRRMVRALTPEYPDDEPWDLVVDDITKPAFMQPPARSDEKLEDYKFRLTTPDELDMLVTSKSFDVKSSVAGQSQSGDWIFALISLQTMEGFGGRYNYGISRMPSGYGNRPAFSITPSDRPGRHVKRDIEALLENRQWFLDEYPMNDTGICLMWAIPWDGTRAEALLLDALEPFYIEVCRRVRLRWESGKLEAIRATSDSRRMVDVKGLTGDPWAPTGKLGNPRGTPPAFLGPRRFSYERVVDGLTSPDWEPPRLLRPTQSERRAPVAMQLVARGMVRGEGRTEGYHERIISLRPNTAQVFGRPAGPQELGDMARDRIRQIGIVQGILRHSVAAFAAGGDTEKTNQVLRSRPQENPWRKKVDELVSNFGEIVDKDFFEYLQEEFDAAESERSDIRKEWLNGLLGDARSIRNLAMDLIPCPKRDYYRARVRAEGVFEGRIRGSQGLSFLFEQSEGEG